MIPRRNLKRYFKKSLSQPLYALRAFAQKLKCFFSYFFLNGYSAYPETISLFLTYNCNLRCNMCAYWGLEGATKLKPREFLNEGLSLEELKKIIDDLSGFKPNITLFGGEPLLFKDWVELVRQIKKRKLRVNVVTNSTLLKDRAAEVVDSGLDEIIFSLEGPKDIHDRITGINGSFDQAVKGLREINEEKKKKLSKKPHLNIACTLSEDNYKFLEEIITIGSSLEAEAVTFHHLCFINRGILERHNEIFKKYFGVESYDWSGFVREDLPKIEVEYFREEVEKIKKSKYPIDVFFYPNFTPQEIKRYYGQFEFTPSSYKNYCLSPWTTVYIFPDGTIRPCEELDFSCGNIKEESFKAIWNNEVYRNFRQIVKKNKVFPVCSRCTEMYRY